jgi:hypothetical protein
MSTWIGADDPGNIPGNEPKPLAELLRAWFGNPEVTMPPCVVFVPSREPEAGL